MLKHFHLTLKPGWAVGYLPVIPKVPACDAEPPDVSEDHMVRTRCRWREFPWLSLTEDLLTDLLLHKNELTLFTLGGILCVSGQLCPEERFGMCCRPFHRIAGENT